MIILRQHLFSSSESENKKDKENEEKRRKKKLKGAGLIAAGSIGTVGGIKGSKKLNKIANINLAKSKLKHYENMESDKKYDSDEINVLKNLIKKSKNLGIKINPRGDDSNYEYETDTINLGSPISATLAHEMGHAAMHKKGRSKDILGRAAHSKAGRAWGIYFEDATNLNANNKVDKVFQHASRGLFLGDGIRRGIKSSKQEESGNTKGAKRTRRNALLISGLSAAPTLIKEASASRKGIKYLKEAGASKEILKNSKKSLGHAFGTYASLAGIPIALEAGGTAIGYGAHKLISKSKNKKKENNNKDKGGENK